MTLVAYGCVASYAYWLYALGPVLAYLRTELRLSYTVATLHSSLWAIGTIATGLTYDRLTRRLGRYAVFWGSAAMCAVGAALFAVAHRVSLTLAATGLLGIAGTMLLAGTSAVLADRHGPHRDRALVEANVGASVAAVAAPLVLGGADHTAAGWRTGLILPALVLLGLFVAFGRDRLPSAPAVPHGREQPRLSLGYWLLGLLTATVVAIEFCVVFFAAPLVHARGHVAIATAATLLSSFYAGELVGRVAGSRLTRRPGRTGPVLLGSLALTGAGLLTVWLSGRLALAAAGLLVTGLGVANLYPLAVALAMRAAPQRTDTASARVLLLIGLATLVAPLSLGALADRVGVGRAFGVEGALILAALALLAAGGRRGASATRP